MSLQATLSTDLCFTGKYTYPQGEAHRVEIHHMRVQVQVDDGSDQTAPSELNTIVRGAVEGYGTLEQGTLSFGRTHGGLLARKLAKDLQELDYTVTSISWHDGTAAATITPKDTHA